MIVTIFSKADKSNDGVISKDEMMAVLGPQMKYNEEQMEVSDKHCRSCPFPI